MKNSESQPAPTMKNKALTRLAAAADADKRTVRNYLEGRSVKPWMAARIKAALAATSAGSDRK
jgi:hypothetical protein